MGNSNFGLSNIYLKAGVGLILAALATLVWVYVASSVQPPSGSLVNIASYALAVGAILYIVGRIVKAKRATETPGAGQT